VAEGMIALSGFDMGEAAGCLLVLRLFRLMRLLKMMRAFPQLQLLAASALNSFPSIVWMCIPLSMLFYIFACIGVFAFGEKDEKYFGNLGRAFVTLVQITTLDTWNTLMYIQMYGCKKYYRDEDKEAFGCDELYEGHGWSASLYFVIFIVINCYCLMNIFIGIVIQKLFESSNEIQELNESLSHVDGMPVESTSFGTGTSAQHDIKRLISSIKRKVDVNRKRTALLKNTLAAM